jgi:hypothetical protein
MTSGEVHPCAMYLVVHERSSGCVSHSGDHHLASSSSCFGRRHGCVGAGADIGHSAGLCSPPKQLLHLSPDGLNHLIPPSSLLPASALSGFQLQTTLCHLPRHLPTWGSGLIPYFRACGDAQICVSCLPLFLICPVPSPSYLLPRRVGVIRHQVTTLFTTMVWDRILKTLSFVTHQVSLCSFPRLEVTKNVIPCVVELRWPLYPNLPRCFVLVCRTHPESFLPTYA